MDSYDVACSNTIRDSGLASEVLGTTFSPFDAETSCEGFTSANSREADTDMIVGTAVSGNLHETFGLLLRALRIEAELTLDQVGRAVGVKKPSVWAWENGKSRPKREKWDTIAGVLGVPSQVLASAAKAEALKKAASVGLRVEGLDRAGMLSAGREMIARAYGVTPAAVKIMVEI